MNEKQMYEIDFCIWHVICNWIICYCSELCYFSGPKSDIYDNTTIELLNKLKQRIFQTLKNQEHPSPTVYYKSKVSSKNLVWKIFFSSRKIKFLVISP